MRLLRNNKSLEKDQHEGSGVGGNAESLDNKEDVVGLET